MWERIASPWEDSFPVTLPPHLDLMAQAVGVGLITMSQGVINHLGISLTAG